MEYNLIKEIRDKLELKSTVELKKIFEENNREEYLDEVFEVIKEILIGRGEEIIENHSVIKGQKHEQGVEGNAVNIVRYAGFWRR